MENGGKVWLHLRQALGTIAAKISPIYAGVTNTVKVISRPSPSCNMRFCALCAADNRLYFPRSWRTDGAESVCATYHSPIPMSSLNLPEPVS